jgi:hypothetical protein
MAVAHRLRGQWFGLETTAADVSRSHVDIRALADVVHKHSPEFEMGGRLLATVSDR